MSFTCGFCGTPQEDGVKPQKVVTKVREVSEMQPSGRKKTRWQIVEEKNCCAECFPYVNKEPEVVGENPLRKS